MELIGTPQVEALIAAFRRMRYGNFRSFTYKLFHYLEQLGAEVVVKRNDELSAADAMALAPDSVVLSPGPCTPNEAGICMDLIRLNNGRIPLLGVCLGHQASGQVYGGKIVRAPEPTHGKLSTIHHTGKSVGMALLFNGYARHFTHAHT